MIIEKNIRAIEARKKSEVPTVKRQRAQELMLLLKLWRQAKLNIYRGYPRKWYQATFQLLKTASSFIVNDNNQSLDEFLLVGCSTSDAMGKEHNIRVLERAKQGDRRLFLIGRLKSFNHDKQRQMLALKEFCELPRISVKYDQIRTLLDANPLAQTALKNENQNVVIIACIEPTNTEWWNTLHIQCIVTSDDMLPLKSDNEFHFCQRLTGEARKFLVPINTDEESGTKNLNFFCSIRLSEHTAKYSLIRRPTINRLCRKQLSAIMPEIRIYVAYFSELNFMGDLPAKSEQL